MVVRIPKLGSCMIGQSSAETIKTENIYPVYIRQSLYSKPRYKMKLQDSKYVKACQKHTQK